MNYDKNDRVILWGPARLVDGNAIGYAAGVLRRQFNKAATELLYSVVCM